MTDFASLFKAFLEKYGLKSIIAVFFTGLVYFFCGINNILELIFIFAGFVVLVCILDNLCSLMFKRWKRYKEVCHSKAEEKRAIDELFYVMPEKAKFNALQLMELPIVPNTKFHLVINDKIEQFFKKSDFDISDYFINTFQYEGYCIYVQQIGNASVLVINPYLYELLTKEKKKREKINK